MKQFYIITALHKGSKSNYGFQSDLLNNSAQEFSGCLPFRIRQSSIFPIALFCIISLKEDADSAHVAFTVNNQVETGINKLTFQQLHFLVNQDLVDLKF